MKKALYTVFSILIFLVLTGKALSWFLDLGDGTDRLLNVLMFTLIGIAYIVMGYAWDHKFLKIAITICGVFLIAMNFLRNNVALDVISIACILIPLLIARFYKAKNAGINVTER
jgi:uncharacterized membrane protein (Fun14 family)